MADCDLCGVAIPTVCPVLVFDPRFEYSYPEGVWKGLCEDCLDSAKKVYDEVSESQAVGVVGKCDLCGTSAQLYEVEISIPSFWKGSDDEIVNLCAKCLEACNEGYARKDEVFEHH